MKKTIPILLTSLTSLAIACATTPTGRKTLHLLPDDQVDQMGAQAFTQMKQQVPVDKDPAKNAFVRCVAGSIISVLPNGLNDPGKWEIQVFQDDTPNAFALPGGKIGVHTGIFKVAKTEGQLATVLAHELGHVIAQHGNERVSETMAASTGLELANALLSTNDPQKAQKRQLLLGLLGLGAQVGILLPFSRTQESEADRIGLDLMAKAGFDPNESIALWKNFEAMGGSQPPAFLSDHPSHGTRIQDLQGHMNEALAEYQDARRAGRNPACAREAPVAVAAE